MVLYFDKIDILTRRVLYMKTLLTCEDGLALFEGGFNFWTWTEDYQKKMYAGDEDKTYVLEVDDSAIKRDDLDGQSFLVDGRGKVTVKGLYEGD